MTADSLLESWSKSIDCEADFEAFPRPWAKFHTKSLGTPTSGKSLDPKSSFKLSGSIEEGTDSQACRQAITKLKTPKARPSSKQGPRSLSKRTPCLEDTMISIMKKEEVKKMKLRKRIRHLEAQLKDSTSQQEQQAMRLEESDRALNGIASQLKAAQIRIDILEGTEAGKVLKEWEREKKSKRTVDKFMAIKLDAARKGLQDKIRPFVAEVQSLRAAQSDLKAAVQGDLMSLMQKLKDDVGEQIMALPLIRNETCWRPHIKFEQISKLERKIADVHHQAVELAGEDIEPEVLSSSPYTIDGNDRLQRQVKRLETVEERLAHVIEMQRGPSWSLTQSTTLGDVIPLNMRNKSQDACCSPHTPMARNVHSSPTVVDKHDDIGRNDIGRNVTESPSGIRSFRKVMERNPHALVSTGSESSLSQSKLNRGTGSISAPLLRGNDMDFEGESRMILPSVSKKGATDLTSKRRSFSSGSSLSPSSSTRRASLRDADFRQHRNPASEDATVGMTKSQVAPSEEAEEGNDGLPTLGRKGHPKGPSRLLPPGQAEDSMETKSTSRRRPKSGSALQTQNRPPVVKRPASGTLVRSDM